MFVAALTNQLVKIMTSQLVALVVLSGLVAAEPVYNVVAPKVIRPNTNYLVSVSVDGVNGDLQEVELKIVGELKSGESFELQESTRVPPGETQLVRFRIPELGEGKFQFVAKGIKPIEFEESTDLEYVHKGYSVLIQTDQAIYRPGNEVKFRVLVLSPQLKPTVTGSIDIEMRDGKGHLIRDWNRVFTTKGVFAGQLEISIKPVLGNWNITADVNGQVFSKTFQVADYVFPKFQVDVELPSYATFSETVTATIKAKYELGQPVKGQATIAVFPRYKSGYIQPIFSDPVRQVVDISGKVDIEFENLFKELKLNNDYAREVVFDVVVEEDKTERRQNNTNSLRMYKFSYKLDLIKTADAFKPGLPYTCYLKVSDQDGRPIKDDLNPVSVKSGFGFNTDAYTSTEYTIPDDGLIRLAFVAPLDDDVQVLGIEAKYKDLSQWFSTIHRAASDSNNYIQARLLTENPTTGKNVKIAVDSSEVLQSFRYEVLGRGNIVQALTVKGTGSTHNEFSVQATKDMSPRAKILVWYTRPDGEIIADAMDFEVEGILTNPVEITINPKQAFPGTIVDVNINAKPNSFIGLLGIDRSVRSLQAGHDIVKEDLIQELYDYDSGYETSFYPWIQTIKNLPGSLYWYTGSSSSKQVFDDSGVFILTNGYLKEGRKVDGSVVVESKGVDRAIGRPIQPPNAQTVQADQGPAVLYETATRPPLAGPYAFSRLPRPVDDLPKIFLKNDLPQTWLFTNATTNSDGFAHVTVPISNLPNTTWIVSAFSLNQLHGMGISESFGQLQIFQPFYVLVNLPYSVRAGETVAVEMVVFNYLSKEISAEVTLENPGGSGFIFGSPNPNEIEDNENPIDFFREKRITIKGGGRTPLSFIITPQEVGNLEIKVTAKSSAGQDIVHEKLRVEAEGETIYHNQAYLVDLTNKGELELDIPVDIPAHAVPKSSKVFVAAVPDPVGPAINNLEDLLYYPTGCGESNMQSLVPILIIRQYLEEVGRSSINIEIQSKHIMELGYQRQLDYQHDDGSFSPFGKTDGRGTVWLTSMTAGSFQGVSQYIDVDPAVIEKALYWLTQNQEQSGAFKEVGPITNRIQKNPVTLTSFALLGFLDNKRNLTVALRNSMNKAISYIAENWQNIEDPYDLSVATYALHAAVHPARDSAWNVLESLALEKKDHKWWQNEVPEQQKGNIWFREPNSANIEMTSYALLCLTSRGGITDAVPVANWLISQQNSIGGFASTADTYVALKALTEFSKGFSIQNRKTDMSIQYEFLNTVRRMKVSSESATTMQKRILPEETRDVKIRATGSGIAIIEVGYQYNLNVTGAWPSFVVNPYVTKTSNANHMKVTVCANLNVGINDTISNMAVMEVNLPSGFTADLDSLPALRRYKGVKRVESDKGDTRVILYFDGLKRPTGFNSNEVCPTVQAFRTHRVAKQKPAHVLVYDYYDQSRRARSFYDIVPATLCDICDGDDCPDDGCPDRPQFPTFGSYAFRETQDDGSSDGIRTHVSCVMTILAFVIARFF